MAIIVTRYGNNGFGVLTKTIQSDCNKEILYLKNNMKYKTITLPDYVDEQDTTKFLEIDTAIIDTCTCALSTAQSTS